MAWVARDSENELTLFQNKPIRDNYRWVIESNGKCMTIEHWMEDIMLKGKILTWEDEPVEIFDI